MLLHYNLPVYHIIKNEIPDIDQRSLLDFGCNHGIFLESSRGSFPQENYTGIDICEDAILMGRKMFPNANFIHYDGFNPEYNPGGKESLPVLDKKYDLIVAHSVFTHTSKEEMLEIVDWLYSHLSENGKMLITWSGYGKKNDVFVGPNAFLRFFPEHRDMDYCYIYQLDDNGKTKSLISQEYLTENVRSFWVYYNINYFQKLLDQYEKTCIIAEDWKQDITIISRD
jgi:hypothetical protein